MTDQNETITRHDDRHRYVLTTSEGAEAGYIEFHESDGVIDLPHTIVDEQYNGRGYGSALVRHVLRDARERGLRVIPTCPFIDKYITRHPEYEDLRA